MKNRWLILLILVLLMVGCSDKKTSPLENKEQLHNLYFDVFEDATVSDKKSGTLDSGVDWEQYQYNYGSLIIMIYYYKDINMNTIIGNTNVDDLSIKGINYKYNESKINDSYVQEKYYTQVDGNTYLISAMYENSSDNKILLRSFLDTITIK